MSIPGYVEASAPEYFEVERLPRSPGNFPRAQARSSSIESMDENSSSSSSLYQTGRWIVGCLLSPIIKFKNYVYDLCIEYLFPCRDSIVLRERGLQYILRSAEASNCTAADLAIQFDLLNSCDREWIFREFFSRENSLLSTEEWMRSAFIDDARFAEFTEIIERRIENIT